MRAPALAALTALLSAVASAATAAPQSAPPSFNPPDAEPCFQSEQVVRYHGDGPRALILRTSTGRYYRIGFAGNCPNVVRKDVAIALAPRGGSNTICRPIDLQVIATASEFPMNCAVDSIQPMTAEQVRALPVKTRP